MVSETSFPPLPHPSPQAEAVCAGSDAAHAQVISSRLERLGLEGEGLFGSLPFAAVKHIQHTGSLLGGWVRSIWGCMSIHLVAPIGRWDPICKFDIKT